VPAPPPLHWCAALWPSPSLKPGTHLIRIGSEIWGVGAIPAQLRRHLRSCRVKLRMPDRISAGPGSKSDHWVRIKPVELHRSGRTAPSPRYGPGRDPFVDPRVCAGKLARSSWPPNRPGGASPTAPTVSHDSAPTEGCPSSPVPLVRDGAILRLGC
jgi:hypothetical protein